MASRTILFIHQAFPGQFGNLARSLATDGHKVHALALNPQGTVSGVTLMKYLPLREQQPTESLPYLLRELDAKTLRGESVRQALATLKRNGFVPDIIYAHPGWGEALFVKNVWPKAKLVVYAEWYYNLHGQEVNFDQEFSELTPEQEMRLTLKNTAFLHALNDADIAITPTQWQKSRFPQWAQEKIHVIHDGLDLAGLNRVAPSVITIPARNVSLKPGMPIVTFVARHLEPVRGFHIFMRALPALLQARPDVHVLILGKDAGIDSGYGTPNDDGKTWRQAMLEELGTSIDLSRVHFTGFVDRKVYLAMLRLSACHVYLTTPFILSWSFLEAAALGLPIVASDTAPVREFEYLKGLHLVPFASHTRLSRKILDVLAENKGIRTPNADLEEKFDAKHCVKKIKSILLG